MAANSSTSPQTPGTAVTDRDAERAAIVAKYEWVSNFHIRYVSSKLLEVGSSFQGRKDGAHIDPWEDPEFEVYGITDRYGFLQ